MTRKVHESRRGLWSCSAAIAGLSVLVGIWNAEDPFADSLKGNPPEATTRQVNQQPKQPSRLEKIESSLAQAGCPGWMVLASEGEAALTPLPEVEDEGITQTSLEVSGDASQLNGPQLGPQPARVANRALFQPPASDRARLAAGSPDEPDDLLDGIPDLLAAPKEQQPTKAKTPVPTELPATIEDTPAEDSPSVENLATESVVDSEPAELTPVEPKISEPGSHPESPKPEGQPEAAFAPPAPPKAEPVQRPEPVQGAPITPAPESPHRSPFAPPPAPTQPTPHSISNAPAEGSNQGTGKTYCEFVAENNFPSAHVCAKCHEKIFDEWCVSSHAYATISPMFQKFEQTINDLSQGTVGYFCYRCHAPVGTTMGVSRATPLWELPQVAREGVTCVACHRVNQRYGKVNGHRRIEPGNIHDTVYGSIGGDGVAEVIAKKDHYKVKSSPHEQGPGQDIHVVGERFDQLGKSEFCVSCHQVAVHPGIKLEVVWEQYRASPACKKGVSCQDCHMGRIPGVKSGYEYGAAAKVAGKVVDSQRKHANHLFYGPGYSIAHPGVFPHNIDALRWSMKDWLMFDWRAGWGTDEFEEMLEAGKIHVSFPPVWSEIDDRYDARDIIEDNLKKLQSKKISRQQVLENGSHVDGPFFDSQLQRGQDLKFHFVMTNTNDGHNLPSGSLGAQPQLWANVVLIGPRGQRLWESGYTDSYGDVCDIHSTDVRNKRIPYDWQLFNLQTMFLITGAKGTDREFFLPVNLDFDQLPYLRPGAQPISVINHPPFIRMEGRSLAPLGSRKIPYKVPAELMYEPGHYRLSFRLRSRAEPIYFMRFCGSTKEMNRAMNEWMVDFHQSSVEFIVK